MYKLGTYPALPYDNQRGKGVDSSAFKKLGVMHFLNLLGGEKAQTSSR